MHGSLEHRSHTEMIVNSVKAHYDDLLAPVYLWMSGGLENALISGAEDVSEVSDRAGLAVDLGAGFGMHSIPLARSGYHVFAIDSSIHLIEQLRSFAKGLSVNAIVGDLLNFRDYIDRPADLILCMGDTLTHLPGLGALEMLSTTVASSLAPNGRFLATFRDYTRLPTAEKRFIPVRSDADRIHTCFLEHQGDTVRVHDILHQKEANNWSMRVSSYSKLRLAPEAVAERFSKAGLNVSVSTGNRGMVKLIART